MSYYMSEKCVTVGINEKINNKFSAISMGAIKKPFSKISKNTRFSNHCDSTRRQLARYLLPDRLRAGVTSTHGTQQYTYRLVW